MPSRRLDWLGSLPSPAGLRPFCIASGLGGGGRSRQTRGQGDWHGVSGGIFITRMHRDELSRRPNLVSIHQGTSLTPCFNRWPDLTDPSFTVYVPLHQSPCRLCLGNRLRYSICHGSSVMGYVMDRYSRRRISCRTVVAWLCVDIVQTAQHPRCSVTGM